MGKTHRRDKYHDHDDKGFVKKNKKRLLKKQLQHFQNISVSEDDEKVEEVWDEMYDEYSDYEEYE
jgi:hypothetical protein